MKIQRVRIGVVQPGDSLCDVDDESLETTEAINADYNADEQDWFMVLRWIELPSFDLLELGTPDGEVIQKPMYDNDLWIWRLTDDKGEPVRNPPPEERS